MKNTSRSPLNLRRLGVASCLVLALTGAARAQVDYVWNLTNGGSWAENTGVNWTPAGSPNATNDTATFAQDFFATNVASATITLDGNFTVNRITHSDTGTTNGGRLTITPGSPLSSVLTLDGVNPLVSTVQGITFTNVISAPNGFFSAGAGSVRLSSSNLISGTVTISNNVELANRQAFSSNVTAVVPTGGRIEVAANVAAATGTNESWTAYIAGTGDGGRGAIRFYRDSGTFTYNGNVFLNADASINSFGGGSGVVVNFGGQFASATNGVRRSLLLFNNAGISTFNFAPAVTLTDLNLVVAGTQSNLTLNLGTNDQLFSQGILVVSNQSAVRVTTVNLKGFSQTIGGLASAGSGAQARLVNVPGTPVTVTINSTSTNAFSGLIGDAVTTNNISLVKTGTGTQILGGTNYATGPTTISGGVLQIGNNAASGNLGLGPITNTAVLTFGRNDTIMFTNVFTGGGRLSKVNGGTVILDIGSETQTMAGLQVRGGTFLVSNGTFLVTNGATTTFTTNQVGFTVAGGGTFRVDGGTVNGGTGFLFPSGHTGGGSGNYVQNGGFFDASGNNEVLCSYGANGGTFTLNGGRFLAQVLRIAQAVGTVNLNGGVLELTRFNFGGGLGTLNLNGATVRARSGSTNFFPVTNLVTANVSTNGFILDTTNFTLTIGQPLVHHSVLGATADGGLVKFGTGALILSAGVTNTYTGNTIISNGTLQVDGSIASSVLTTIIAGSRLAGTGTVGAAVIDGTLSPGWTSVGTLNAGDVTIGTNTVYQFQNDGTNTDRFAANTVTFSNTWSLVVSGTPLSNGIYVVMSTVAGVTNFMAPTLSGSSGTVSLSGNDVVLTVGGGLTPFETWQINYFGTTTNVDAAYDQDPDGDGANNLLEYAFATSPISGASVALPQTGTSGDYLTITVPRNSNATDISYEVLGSTNLLDWETNVVLTATNPAPAGTTVTYTNATAFSTQPTQFLRVKVTQP